MEGRDGPVRGLPERSRQGVRHPAFRASAGRLESNGWIVRTVIDLFGADRAMFGSNSPVDSLCAWLDEILDGFATILAPLPEAEQEAFFAATARRVYELPTLAESG